MDEVIKAVIYQNHCGIYFLQSSIYVCTWGEGTNKMIIGPGFPNAKQDTACKLSSTEEMSFQIC